MHNDQLKLAPGARIYFMGIAGTGMAAVAGLMQSHGFKVSGSDSAIYPPTSELLDDLAISVASPYAPENITNTHPDLIIVANALSRGHPELEKALSLNIPYTSFPKLLGDLILSKLCSIVVAGTHGKTTTVSLLAHLLTQLGEEPSYLIGGIPRDLPLPFARGRGDLFVIEGDEYDTAFFDKHAKFLHYRPQYAILNNLEFDHADIFPNLAAIEAEFTKLISLCTDPSKLLVNIDDPRLFELIQKLGLLDKITQVSTSGLKSGAAYKLLHAKSCSSRQGYWQIGLKSPQHGRLELETQLSGTHNAANIVQAIALLGCLEESGKIKKPKPGAIAAAVASFRGAKRRLELLGKHNDIEIYEDFAHHPTAVKLVLEGYRSSEPNRRLLVAFEPKNATSRRNVFTNEFALALGIADRIYLGKCPEDKRIAEEQRMSTATLAAIIGNKAQAFSENEALLAEIQREVRPGDTVIFMSAGSFSGIQHRLASEIS